LIKDSARASETRFNYLRNVATQQNFIDMMKKKPRALHISCHGIKNRPETVGRDFQQFKDDGDFLLFENQWAEGQLVSKKQLSKVIRYYLPTLDLVFVAACKSEFVGQIFQLAGAKHVICVREGAEILDEAVLVFTKNFYDEILVNRTSICEAFKKAQASVEF
jgi:hypothetical protein